jgi:tetratricopeptide (TPR) repeat protein
MPVEVKVETEGNPEFKEIDVIGLESPFVVETFGRPKPGGITLDPNNHLLKSSPALRVRSLIAQGEDFAEQGKYLEAIETYQRALSIQKNNSLAHFRMGEAFFFQKNYQASANAFRDAIEGDLALSYKWVEVWSHIYLGKIFDISGQRDRAVNEYSKARELNDDTGGALAEIEALLKTPYTGESQKAEARPNS